MNEGMQASNQRTECERDQPTELEIRAKNTIKDLNSEYSNLSNAEAIIIEQLEKLKGDETLLQIALAQSKENVRDKIAREKSLVDNEALKNLHAALMGDDDDDSSRDSDDDLHSTNMNGVALGVVEPMSDEE